MRRAPRKSRSWWRASCCRISRACRCWWTWRPCARPWRAWARTRSSSSRWCRWTWWWTTRCRWTSSERRTHCARNLEMEFNRNRERYQLLKWGMQAFETFKVVPPGIGIVHQVNLEYLAKGVLSSAHGVYLPGHAGGHGLAHDDDQRAGHRGLGRGRHRGGGGHARASRCIS